MANRSTITLVKSVIITALTDLEITDLITQANAIVTRVTAGQTITEETLTDIETWLTAHLIAVGKERQTVGEKVGDIWLQFEKLGGKAFLDLTTYGRMVLFLDPTSSFQSMSMKRASIKAIKQNKDNMGTSTY